MRKFAAVLLALLVIGGLVWIINPGGIRGKLVGAAGSAAGALGEFVAGQALRIGQQYLEPTVAYSSFTYLPPGTLELHGLTLTAEDGTRVVEAGIAKVILAEVPRMGSPIVIKEVELKDARLRLIQTTLPDGTTGFKGLVPFVKRDAVRDQDSAPGDVKLSEVLRIRRLALDNAAVEYDAGKGGPPMVVDRISLETGVEPRTDGRGYALDVSLDRLPAFDLEFKGVFDVDALTLGLEGLTLDIDMQDEAGVAVLPPQLQEVLAAHDARGRVVFAASGDVLLADPVSSTVEGELTITEFNAATGDFRLPIDRAEFPFVLESGTLHSDAITAHTIGGVLSITGVRVGLREAGRPAVLAWTGEGLQVRELMRAQATAGEAPPLAGLLVTSGRASTSLDDPLAAMDGGGSLSLTQGRLMMMPLVVKFGEMFNVLQFMRDDTELVHTLDAEFDLTAEGAEFSKIDIDTPAIVARGEGLMGYDGSLDFEFNAGPVEKLQSNMGVVGDIFGAVTDSFMKYHIEGRVGAPTVSVKPLGI